MLNYKPSEYEAKIKEAQEIRRTISGQIDLFGQTHEEAQMEIRKNPETFRKYLREDQIQRILSQ